MRIIGGEAGGRRLRTPRGPGIRPTSDRVKEALFNILGERVPDSDFLDLFAGTGAVGIEALSRGARLAIFVELDRKVISTIRRNLSNTGLEDCAEVYSLDVLRAIKVLGSKSCKFGIVFLGAPYDSPALEKALELLSVSDIIRDGGVVVAEHRAKHIIADSFGTLTRTRDKRYGDTVLTFYERTENSFVG